MLPCRDRPMVASGGRSAAATATPSELVLRGSLARGGPLRAKMCTSSLYCSARGRHPAVWRMRTAAEKDIVRKPEPVLRLRRYWQDATLSWPAPARLCCQSFSLLTPSRRAGLRSGEPMPIAGGNLGAPKLAPPLPLQRPRVPGPCRAFSGEELRITDRIRRLPTARTSLHQLHCLKTHKLRLSVFALFCLRHYSEPIGTALGCARAVSCYGSFGHGSKRGSTFAVGRKSMCQPWKVSA
jgi:hypothetical protein